ncbi:hypothetical protein ACVU7I_11615, partial [Patulibacter sp. S7RM1-6]
MTEVDLLPLVAGHLRVLGDRSTWSIPASHEGAALCVLDALLALDRPPAAVARALDGYARLRRAQGRDPTPDTPLDLAVAVHGVGGPTRFAALLADHGGAPPPADVERCAAAYRVATALAEEGVSRPGQVAVAGPGVHEHLRLRWVAAAGPDGEATWERFLLLCGVTGPGTDSAPRAFVGQALGPPDGRRVPARTARE